MTTVCSEGPRFNTQGDTPPMWTGGSCSERALVTMWFVSGKWTAGPSSKHSPLDQAREGEGARKQESG